MSSIAEVLLALGYDVRGSDTKHSSTTDRLGIIGAKVFMGHSAENVADADLLVVSSAIDGNNSEVKEARGRGIPMIHRADVLAELMRSRDGIAIAGAHGKSTTTSLIATILDHGGYDPTIVIGARLKSTGSGARLGLGKYLVAEADESDGSFLRLGPTIAVVTNVDLEHVAYYKTLPNIVNAFVDFVNRVPNHGLAVLCTDSPEVLTMLPRIKARVMTYGFSHADYVAEDVEISSSGTIFTVKKGGNTLGQVSLKLIGRHNVLNSLASIAVGDELGSPKLSRRWENVRVLSTVSTTRVRRRI